MMDDEQGVRHEPTVAREEEEEEEEDAAPSDDEFEFEFPSVSRDSNDDGGCCGGGGAAAADELFAGGRVRAFYPVFGRVLSDAAAPDREPPSRRAPLGRLFQLETSSTSSSSSTCSSAGGELDDAPADSYCLWTPGGPSPAASSPSRPPRKSGSTGSVARWRRVGELVVGRSQSDGRDKFRFLSAPPLSPPIRERAYSSDTKAKKKQPAGKGSKADDTVAAGRRTSYSSYGGAKGPRRTFLPYRQDLVGLFAGVHRGHHHHHPF